MMSSNSIFVVDQSLDSALKTEHSLKARGFVVKLFHHSKNALAAILKKPPAAVVIETDLGDMTGAELSTAVHQRLGKQAPTFVVYSTSITENFTDDALKRGVKDFVSKSGPACLLGLKIKLLLEDKRRSSTSIEWQNYGGKAQEFGPYLVEYQLAKGGMSTVYLARHKDHGQQVAIKTIKKINVDQENETKRFNREIKALLQLNHPNLVRIFDSGETEDSLFYVMEYIKDLTLLDLIELKGPLSIALTASILSEIAEALDYVHGQQIVHRDVKPENILISQSRGPLLSDFGTIIGQNDPRLTKTNALIGTPNYMSPECIQGFPVTQSTDLFALGLSTLAMLNGGQVIAGKIPFELMDCIVNGQFPSPRQICECREIEAPEAFLKAIDGLLMPNQFQRTHSARIFKDQIAEFATIDNWNIWEYDT